MAVYKVGANGQAPIGLRPGDVVHTNGGLYNIVQPGTPGGKYNPATGYTSIKANGQLQDSLTAYAQATSERNTAKSQDYAREQMKFQEQSNAKAMQFSAEQAQLNRQWQERMSNTAHQREVSDLISAGLNPILSAQNGASTPSGASATGVSSQGAQGSVDNSSQQMIGALLSAVIGQATALKTTSMNNMTALESSKMGLSGILGSASITARSNQDIAQKNKDFEAYLKANYPQSVTGGVSSVVHKLNEIIEKGYTGKTFMDRLDDLDKFMRKLYEVPEDW